MSVNFQVLNCSPNNSKKQVKKVTAYLKIFAISYSFAFIDHNISSDLIFKNLLEIELNVLNGQCLNRRIDNINTVKQEDKAWQDHRNNKHSIINWRFATKDARIKLKRLYLSIEG